MAARTAAARPNNAVVEHDGDIGVVLVLCCGTVKADAPESRMAATAILHFMVDLFVRTFQQTGIIPRGIKLNQPQRNPPMREAPMRARAEREWWRQPIVVSFFH